MAQHNSWEPDGPAAFQNLVRLHVTEARSHLTATLSNPGFLCSSQWLTRCNFPYGKCYCHHSRQKFQYLYSSQFWNLAVIWITVLGYSSRGNQERTRWTHTLVLRSFPLLNCQLTPQLCFELFQRALSKTKPGVAPGTVCTPEIAPWKAYGWDHTKDGSLHPVLAPV